LLRGGVLQQITRDHSLVSDLVENGTITQEQARTHPRKNVLMRAVGVEEELIVDTGSFELQSGDSILLCTDGLTNMVENEEIQRLLQVPEEQDKASALVAAALEAGGLDNVTAVVVVYDAE
jgi:protein phosphatase